MELIGIALIVFSTVLLVCVIYYVSAQIRHKEKMVMLEKGMDPADYCNHIFQEALRLGAAMLGAGIGFFIGVWLESSNIFPSQIEMPLYFAPILICTGTALIIFYKVFRNKNN
ncbi:DUF6249 domain-containing protein [Splendidivirga corallicola]|uniref:DUF6249 domain-containing protein n=1 Tax=Splendidivirga corallicola TaxID=3051826 RepID=UPI003211B7AE